MPTTTPPPVQRNSEEPVRMWPFVLMLLAVFGWLLWDSVEWNENDSFVFHNPLTAESRAAEASLERLKQHAVQHHKVMGLTKDQVTIEGYIGIRGVLTHDREYHMRDLFRQKLMDRMFEDVLGVQDRGKFTDELLKALEDEYQFVVTSIRFFEPSGRIRCDETGCFLIKKPELKSADKSK